MKRILSNILSRPLAGTALTAPALFLCMILSVCLLSACSNETGLDLFPAESKTLSLVVSLPPEDSSKRAIGDPGTDTGEGIDWDRLAIMIAYTDDSEIYYPNNRRVLIHTLSKTEFEALPLYSVGTPDIRLLTLNVQVGKIYVYGVTYSSGAANSPEDDILACSGNAGFQQLTISNSYAAGDANQTGKFLSVASGCYDGGSGSGQPVAYDMTDPATAEQAVIMRLSRLATKIDVQWDAADAITAGYTDVKVTGFKYNGTAAGRLFPSITPNGYNAQPKVWDFHNTDDISQRNGRAYHYTFTDGANVPSVTFNITAKKTGTTPDPNYDYTLTFPSMLNRAAWYKVNATIKGVTGNGSITLSTDGGTQAGG